MTRLTLSLIVEGLFPFRGYKLVFADLKDATFTFTFEGVRKTGDCPKCGRRCANFDGSYTRIVRDLDAWGCRTCIVFPERRIRCKCGYRGMEKVEFTDPYSRCTRRMEEYVFRLCKIMTVHDAAELVKLGWHTVKNIDKKHIGKLTVGLAEANPSKIGVDEVAYTKGHNYLTVVRDIDLGKVMWVGFSRTKETLDSFFQELGPLKSRAVRVAVTDMWDPYIASVREHTDADIVFDKFHIAKKVNEVLDLVRKQEFAQADPVERKEMKHKRYLILSRNKNVEGERREELDTLLKQNETLSKAYLLKEQVLDIFDETDPDVAQKRLRKWVQNVKKSGITVFEGVVNTIQNYLYGIINYFKHQLTNAASEAINNKINVIKRRAYGFRDIEYFKLKIIQLCGVNNPTNQR